MKRQLELATLTLTLLVLATPVAAQTNTNREQPASDRASEQAVASDGGTVQVSEARPVAESEDPVNQLVAADTVDGLVISVTIDGASVVLDSASLARVPRRLTKPRRDTGADMVTFTAIVNGRATSVTVVPDNVINASEGGGLVRMTRRQIAAVLATDQPLDAVRVEAPATGAAATVDVRSAYARICEADRNNKWCPRRQ